MLKAIAPDIWHVPHHFTASGIPVSSRMTVVRLWNDSLWLHSPVPLTVEDQSALKALGTVKYIVAPNKAHHLFASVCLATFPEAKLFGAPGLLVKRPDLIGMTALSPTVELEWRDDLDQVFFDGIPLSNETVWFHNSSKTLIVTDLCQWWQGDLPIGAKAYAHLTGVRNQLAVPRTVRFFVKDRQAAQASAQQILQWPFERVIMAHNSIVEDNAYAAVKVAFAVFHCKG